MEKVKNWLKKEVTEYGVLLRSVPSHVVTLFVVSVIFMNVFASVALVQLPWLALDAGILLSWLSFLTMDVICKRFGAKAANEITIFAIFINLVCIGFFNIVKLIVAATPDWNGWLGGDSGVFSVLASDWKTLFSSMVAMLVAACVNNFINVSIKKKFQNKSSFKEFAVASYVSTMIGQFVDNFTFAVFAHLIFNIWGSPLSLIQIVMFALTGAVVELLCEVIFSPFGYRISNDWEKHSVGQEYLTLVSE